MSKWTDLVLFGYGFLATVVAWLRNALTWTGYAFALLLALALYRIGGAAFIALLLVFFISSSLFSRVGKSFKHRIEVKMSARSGRRDAIQVLANGGPALIMALLFVWLQEPVYSLAVSAAFAASNADTWASELGILSKKRPVSFLTGRPVRRGLSGGVTLVGCIASTAGAALIGLVSALFQMRTLSFAALLLHFLLITLAGLFGSLVDSLLGDTLQAKYLDHAGQITEKSHSNGRPHRLHRGLAFVNNDWVNFVSGLLAATLLLVMVKVTGT